jgi:hypothetical protein
MTLTAKEIQDSIVTFVKAHPRQTHADVAARLGCSADLSRIAINMDALAKAGILEFEREGWDGNSNTKRYSLVG